MMDLDSGTHHPLSSYGVPVSVQDYRSAEKRSVCYYIRVLTLAAHRR